MSTKAEWQAGNRQWIEEQRARLGEPPTAEEMLAYMRGELSGEDEERMRERLACYPELSRSLAAPFPEEPRVATSSAFTYSKVMAVAATILLLFTVLLWREHRKAAEPQVTWETVPLLPDGARGPESSPALPVQSDYVLVPALIDQRVFPDYRVEIIDANAGRVVWRRRSVQRRENDTLLIYVHRAYLERGRYQLAVYGIDGDREERLATYTFRVP